MTRSASHRHAADHLVPPGLRTRLETGRLELRAWLRALDELHLAQDLPPELRDLMELDADLAEALLVLDQPAGGFNWTAMTADTLASLAALPDAQRALLDTLSPAARRRLTTHVPTVRAALRPTDAYLDIPGRDPRA
jgi:hypothetical protein